MIGEGQTSGTSLQLKLLCERIGAIKASNSKQSMLCRKIKKELRSGPPMVPLLAALFAMSLGQIPLMNHKDMFFWGPDSAVIKMLFVIDFQCPDSAASWPTMQQLVALYSGALQIRVMGLPLPYHHNAFFASQAARIVAQLNGTKQSYFDYGTLLFQNQGKIDLFVHL